MEPSRRPHFVGAALEGGHDGTEEDYENQVDRADSDLGTGTIRLAIAIAITIAITTAGAVAIATAIARVQAQRSVVVGSNDLCGLFSETIDRRHQVCSPFDGEDGPIDDTEVRDTVHAEIGIDDTT